MERILKKVLKDITPTKNERGELSGVLKTLMGATEDVIKPLKLEKTIAGSLIRDTWLSDKKEIDLFILFPVSYSRERLERMGLDIGKRIIKKVKGRYEIAYAEHPYVKGKIDGFAIDIVPCYKVSSASNIKSAVDRTPFHNRYITRCLKPEMSKEVRLLKQMCKASDVYGSDVKTLGFSGYLCELLIIKYRTFSKLVNSAKNWEFGEFIDLGSHCIFSKPHKQFKDQPLIVIDPTDPKRNVAAALSNGNFIRFVETCSKFVKTPSERFFKIDKKVITKSKFRGYLEGRGTKLFVVEFRRPKVVDDILWSQMRKTSNRMVKLSKENEFGVFGNSVWSNDKHSYIMFEMRLWQLPEMQKLTGPPVSSKAHSSEFMEKYKKYKMYIEGERWAVEITRKYRKFDGLLRDFLDRPKKDLLNDGVRSNIAKSVSKNFRIMGSEGVEKLIGEKGEFSVFLRKYFERGL